MPSQWFSNRGQMIQVACAVLAVLIGIAAQWSQLSVAINFGEILKVLLYPISVLVGFQLGLRAFKGAPQAAITQAPQTVATAANSLPSQTEANPPSGARSIFGPDFSYKFSTPTIKVGSFFEVGQELGLRRVSALSIKTVKIGSDEVPAAEVEVAGHVLDFNAGDKVDLIHSKKALIPANARALKVVDSSIFDFTYQPNSFSFAAIGVDHINVPAQEITLVICLASYRK